MKNEYVTIVRDEYIPHARTTLDELRGLDRKVKLLPSVFAYTLGCIAALIFGTGMCLAMSVIGAPLMSPAVLMTVGVIVGCVGIALCIANYFFYRVALKSRKKKYGDRIVALSNELLNQEG